MTLTNLYREIEALGGIVVMDDYEEGHRDGLEAALAVLRKYGFGVDMAPANDNEERVMDKIDDGGPAYPAKLRTGKIVVAEEPIEGYPYVTQPVVAEEVRDHPGMSLRDYFAGMALSGQLANIGRVGDFARRASAAKEAYFWADAMLEARKAAA